MHPIHPVRLAAVRLAAVRLAAVFVVAVVGGLAVGVGPASAAAPANGCPAAFTLMAVDSFPSGYHAPALVDSPTSGIESFGRAGNGDGAICALPLDGKLTSFGGQEYLFVDNGLPA